MSTMTERSQPGGLPPTCYALSPYTGQPVAITQGERFFCGCRAMVDVYQANLALGVTKAQFSAMVGGVLYGWDTPQADPANYTRAGQYMGPERKDR